MKGEGAGGGGGDERRLHQRPCLPAGSVPRGERVAGAGESAHAPRRAWAGVGERNRVDAVRARRLFRQLTGAHARRSHVAGRMTRALAVGCWGEGVLGRVWVAQ